MATQPNLMRMPFCANGAKATIPDTTTSLGVASLSQGFPTETQMPIEDGGVPPRRVDVNGALNMLSMFAMFQQTGGKFSWSAELDYDVPSIIYHNGDLWWCLRSNGISSNVVEPGTNANYWILFKRYISSPLDAYPIGSYYISSVSTSPATLFGGTWVRVENRMIMAAGSSYTAGSTGGSATHSLSVANIPSHNHSCNSVGNHTHTRGTMNITGRVGCFGEEGTNYPNGAFYQTKEMGTGHEGGDDYMVYMDASRNWSGATSSNGIHQHSIGYTGSGTAFNTMPPYIVAYVWRRTA